MAESKHTPTAQELRAKAPWYVSGTRTRHNSMPVLQIISEPTGEVLALVPYSDRTPTAHAECYADARCIAAAPELLDALTKAREWVERGPELPGVSPEDEADARAALAQIDAAIAKATGAA